MDTIASYEAWRAKQQQGKAAAAGIVLDTINVKPDEVASDMMLASEYAKSTGKPVPPLALVTENRSIFQQQIERKKNATLLSSSPMLAEWLRKPDNAAVARDDLEGLSWFEGFGRGVAGAGKRSVERLGQAGNQAALEQTAGRAKDRQSSFGEILESERDTIKTSEGDEKAWVNLSDLIGASGRWIDAKYADLIGADDQAAAEQFGANLKASRERLAAIPKSEIATTFETEAFAGEGGLGEAVANFSSAFARNPLGGLSWALETAGESAPQMAAALAAAITTRNPAIGVGVLGGGSYATERFTAPAEFLDEKGFDLGKPEDIQRLIADPDLMKEAADRGVVRGLVIAAFDMVSAGVAGRALVGNPVVEALAQGVQQMIFGASGEYAARTAAGQEIDWNDILAEGFAEMATTPVDMGVAGRKFVSDRRAARSAEAQEQKIKELAAGSTASVLRARMPDAFRDFVARATENGPVENVYVPASEFVEYFQGLSIDPFALTDELDGVTSDDLRTALATGGDLQIPTATYAAKMAGSDHDAFLMENMRFNPDEMTAREAKEFNERAADAMQEAFEEAERMRADDEQYRALEGQIYDDMVSRLRVAGRSTDVATSEAMLYPAFYRVMAERSGLTTEEFLARYPLPEVRGEVPQGLQLKNVDALTRTLAEARAQKSVGVDNRQTLLEFIAAYGGINDRGGELKARDAEVVAGRGRKKLKLARGGVAAGVRDMFGSTGGKKFGPDDVAQAAIDAGFMADDAVVVAYREALETGSEIPDIGAALWEAIDRELAGAKSYSKDQAKSEAIETDEALERIEAYLSGLGVSLDDDDAVVREAIERDQADEGRRYGQAPVNTETPEFKAWFGASKVVDADGKPLVVYHGTRGDFDRLNPSTGGEFGAGVYFSEHPEVASGFGSMARGDGGVSVYPAYLSMQNPFVTNDRNAARGAGVKKLQRQGYDGVIGIAPNGERQFVAFSPTQIKSVNNRGTFDPADPRLLFQAETEFAAVAREKALADELFAALKGNRKDETAVKAAFDQMVNTSKAKDALVAALAATDSGVELTNSSGLNAAVTKSQNGTDGWRTTYFDNRGFSGHTEHPTKAGALKQAIFEGYIIQDEGALRRHMAGGTFFQRVTEHAQSGGPGPRGSIQFPGAGIGNGQTIISLFKSADLSTFIHETGHYFLSVMQDLSARGEIASGEDFNAVKNWWHANAGDVAKDAMRVMPDVVIAPEDVISAIELGSTGDVMKDAAIDVGMQEQFARAFEAYLLEGKSPSIELRSAFEKFRAWLISIYRKVSGLNVEISDELRAVFDRMLATDQEIAKARQDSADRGPVFATAEEMGLSPEDYAAFLKLNSQAQAEAAAKLLAETMAPIRRETEKWFKDERAKVRDEVEKDLRSQRVYRATQELRFGRTFEGDEAPGVKLDREAIKKQYGAGYLPFLPGATKDGKGHRNAVFASDGLHPDVVAEMYGFKTGDELLDALTNAPAIAEAIETQTDRTMFELHGDPLRDGSVEAAAMDAVHSDKRAQALATELRAMVEIAGSDRGLTHKEAREIARQTLARTKVRDATNAGRFLAAERKAGEEAARLGSAVTRTGLWMAAARRRVSVKARAAVRAGDAAATAAVPAQVDRANESTGRHNENVEKFIEAKRRQLLNHALYMESRITSATVEKIVTRASKLNRADRKLSNSADIDHAKAARAIAAKFGLARPDPAFDFAMWIEQMRAMEPITADAMTLAIQTYSQDAKPFKDLTVSEIGAVADAIENVISAGRRLKNLEIEGKQVDREDAKAELMEILGNRDKRENKALAKKLGGVDKAKVGALSILSSLRRMEAWTRDMDDGEQGPFTRYLVRPVMGALDAYRTDRAARMKQLLDIINGRKEALFGKAIAATELGYTFENKAELLHALLHTGNASNKEKLLLGRGWSAGFVNQTQAVTAAGRLRAKRDGSAVMTRGELDTSAWDAFMARMFSEGVVTAEDIKTANEIWALMESTKRPAQATHKKIFGHYFKEIEATPYDTPVGRLNGGYIPAIADTDASNDGQIRADQAALDTQQTSFMFPTAGSGFTKSRVQNYRTALSMNLGLLPAHLDKVLRFTHLDPVIRQTASLVNDKELRAEIDAFDKTILPNLVIPWLQRTAQQAVEGQPTTPAGRAASTIWRTIRRRVGLHTMFANVINSAQQVTGLSSAMVLVKPALVKSALVRFVKGGAGTMRREAFAASPFMRERIENASRETQARIQDAITQPNTVGDMKLWIERHGYFMQTAAQNVIDVPVWHAAYDQAIGKGMSDADAVFEADSVIRRTMSAMDPESISLFESGSAFTRLFTMFYSYFGGQANLVGGEMQTVMRVHGWNGKGRMFFIYLFGLAIPAIIGEAIVQAGRGEFGDDDDDGYGDDLLELFFGAQVRYIAGAVPVAGPLSMAAVNRFNSHFYDDRLSTSPVVSAAERAVSAPATILDAMFGDGDASRAVGDGLTALGLITGIPAAWFIKPVSYAIDVAEGDAEPEGIADVMQGIVSGRDGTAN